MKKSRFLSLVLGPLLVILCPLLVISRDKPFTTGNKPFDSAQDRQQTTNGFTTVQQAYTGNVKSTFPIYPYFQMQRNFGYHIGDAIPLTLVIEAKKDTVLDLVNLPHKGEVHGDFEILDLKIRTEEATDTRVYRVDFTLQTFKPVLAVDTLSFPPLDILYSTSEGINSLSGEYQYKSLLSPPHDISFSRTAVYFGDLKDIKGVINEKHTLLAWGVILVGTLLWTGTLGSWIWNWYLHRIARVRPKRKLSLEEKALQTITETWEQYIIHGGRIKDIFSTISLAFREYLEAVYHIPIMGKTFLQLKEILQGKSYQAEILEILGKCQVILYEGYIPGRRELEETIQQLMTLIQQVSVTPRTVE